MRRDVDYHHVETQLAGVLGAQGAMIREVTFPEPHRIQTWGGDQFTVDGPDERRLRADVFEAKNTPRLGEMIDVGGGLQILITEYTRDFCGIDSVNFTLFARAFDLWAEMRAAIGDGR